MLYDGVDAASLTDRELVALRLSTAFVRDEAGRLLRSNSPDPPDRLVAPRMYLAGCAEGNEVGFRYDIDPHVCAEIETLIRNEPPLIDVREAPVHREDYLGLLGGLSEVVSVRSGLLWTFPESVEYSSESPLIHSETAEGERLFERLRQEGTPKAMRDVGFKDVDEFWPPWCIALHEDEIASIAFAARRGPSAAEVGVTTVPHLRRRGYATAATACWSRIPSLHGLPRFYSTDRDNTSSRHVAERLQLRYLGATFAIM